MSVLHFYTFYFTFSQFFLQVYDKRKRGNTKQSPWGRVFPCEMNSQLSGNSYELPTIPNYAKQLRVVKLGILGNFWEWKIWAVCRLGIPRNSQKFSEIPKNS